MSRSHRTVACGRGSHGDDRIPAPWLPLGPEDEGEGGGDEEPDQKGPHGNRHGTTHCHRAAEKPVPWKVIAISSQLDICLTLPARWSAERMRRTRSAKSTVRLFPPHNRLLRDGDTR